MCPLVRIAITDSWQYSRPLSVTMRLLNTGRICFTLPDPLFRESFTVLVNAIVSVSKNRNNGGHGSIPVR